MTHEDSFKLMELMIKMGFEPILIMCTLNECAYGKAIGPSFVDAVMAQKEITCKTDTHK